MAKRASTKSKTDNFKGKGDHDDNGTVGGAKQPEAAAAPGTTPEPAPAAEPAPKPRAAAKPTARTGMPQPGEIVIMHSPNPINGRMSNPAKVIRHNDRGQTLALEVTLVTGAKLIFNSIGNIEQPGQQWWRWPDVDGEGAAA